MTTGETESHRPAEHSFHPCSGYDRADVLYRCLDGGFAWGRGIGIDRPCRTSHVALRFVGGSRRYGFSVQAAHFIGANDFEKARAVMRHGYIFGLAFSLILMSVAALISGFLPRWLGGGA